MPASASSSPSSSPHWIVPFASSLSEPCLHALPHLTADGRLPHLRRLLAGLREHARLGADEYALSMPHERVLAAEMGWPDVDGQMPWSAWWAAQDQVSLDPARTWGLLSPGHWLMGRDHLTLLDPQGLGLSETDSRGLLEAIRPLFESDGWTLQWGSPTRWYAAHESLRDLPTAALDRVIGRNPDLWLTDHPQARMVRRLQSEVQMLLYQHPINDAREAAGQATVNSFWLSGCGQPPVQTSLPPNIRLIDTLRAPLLADDMPLWVDAWSHVDATVLKEVCDAMDAGQTLRLTLCGERHAITLGPAPSVGWSQRMKQVVKRLTGASGAGADLLAFLREL